MKIDHSKGVITEFRPVKPRREARHTIRCNFKGQHYYLRCDKNWSVSEGQPICFMGVSHARDYWYKNYLRPPIVGDDMGKPYIQGPEQGQYPIRTGKSINRRYHG